VIGPLEIVIILLIIGVVFAGYFRKRLPEFGRKAGETARVGGEKAKEIASQTGEKAGDKWDSQAIGRKAGEGLREAREIRDSFKGALDSPPPKQSSAPTAGSAAEASDDATAAPDEPLPADDEESRRADSNR
jgi:Sec-independent protein translocase protein TatA